MREAPPYQKSIQVLLNFLDQLKLTRGKRWFEYEILDFLRRMGKQDGD